jgi:hypothetical protein
MRSFCLRALTERALANFLITFILRWFAKMFSGTPTGCLANTFCGTPASWLAKAIVWWGCDGARSIIGERKSFSICVEPMSDKKSTAFSNGHAKKEPDGAAAVADPDIAGLG